ncbi:hypothetical protein BDF14DRAFT_1860639, partial [Spinellus fusiger]
MEEDKDLEAFSLQEQSYLEQIYTTEHTELPLYPVQHNGEQILVLINSGASANYVSPQVARYAWEIRPIAKKTVETARGHVITIN